jgi:hypothetical protein
VKTTEETTSDDSENLFTVKSGKQHEREGSYLDGMMVAEHSFVFSSLRADENI